MQKKTGQKFNYYTPNYCDICRTIFTDKTILPILRDHVFEIATYPLLFHKHSAKIINEHRTKR